MNTSRASATTKRSPEKRARLFLQQVGVARSCELERAGVSRTQLRRLRASGVLERVGWGLYRLADAPLTERQDLAEAVQAAPSGIICLLSALRFHDLTTQNPFQVWMAIPRKAWRPQVDQIPLRLIYLSGPSLTEGIESHDVGGVAVPVYSAAKTVADCFKFRNKIGTDVAVEALRAYRRRHPKGLDALWRFAKIDRVTRILRPYLAALG